MERKMIEEELHRLSRENERLYRVNERLNRENERLNFVNYIRFMSNERKWLPYVFVSFVVLIIGSQLMFYNQVDKIQKQFDQFNDAHENARVLVIDVENDNKLLQAYHHRHDLIPLLVDSKDLKSQACLCKDGEDENSSLVCNHGESCDETAIGHCEELHDGYTCKPSEY